MDRFIDLIYKVYNSICNSLKSNMDRFIVTKLRKGNKWCKGLKSNMDRFIGFDIKPNFLEHIKFKIQYG